MLYESTRGGTKGITSAEAIKKGIALDGGLFVPEQMVKVSEQDISRMTAMTYNQRALLILKKFLDDFTEDELTECIEDAYSYPKFDTPAIAPIRKYSNTVSVLELWHGPTSAFKDMALQILPHLLVYSVKKTGEQSEMVILVATSGDTGKAALEGFKDVEGTRIIVFYPQNGVSQIQKMQMITQEGANVSVCAIDGNFDDAQNGVKAIFGDFVLEKELDSIGFKFSSANSINWGRLVPQIVYYFSGYADMIAQATIECGDKINIVVPTGNFGNILAAYFAKEMGLPINKLICASNENNVLADFINTGRYDRKRDFVRSVSPSMDILISSNLERLLYLLSDRDAKSVKGLMFHLAKDGEYDVPADVFAKIEDAFFGDWCSTDETLEQIKIVYENKKYVIDTHTAVAFGVYEKYIEKTGDSETKTMIVSTASPFKFNESVCSALFGQNELEKKDEFELLNILAKRCSIEVPDGLKNLDKKNINFDKICIVNDMSLVVKELLLKRC